MPANQFMPIYSKMPSYGIVLRRSRVGKPGKRIAKPKSGPFAACVNRGAASGQSTVKPWTGRGERLEDLMEADARD